MGKELRPVTAELSRRAAKRGLLAALRSARRKWLYYSKVSYDEWLSNNNSVSIVQPSDRCALCYYHSYVCQNCVMRDKDSYRCDECVIDAVSTYASLNSYCYNIADTWKRFQARAKEVIQLIDCCIKDELTKQKKERNEDEGKD